MSGGTGRTGVRQFDIDSRPGLRAWLGEAFPAESPPDVISTLRGTDDGARACEMLAGRRWHDVTVAEVDAIRGALLFVTPAAFRYYVPAFAMAAVFSGRYGQDHAAHLLLCLSRRFEQGPGPYARYFASRGAALSDAQHTRIVDVLARTVDGLAARPRPYWVRTLFESELAQVGRPSAAAPADAAEPWASLAETRDAIVRALPTAPLPPPTAIVRDAHAGTDSLDVHRLFGGEPWTTASLGALMWGRASIFFLTPVGFAHYLPAYLVGMLDPTVFGAEIGATLEFALAHLLDQLAIHPNHPRPAAQWAALSTAQRLVVARALAERARREGDRALADTASRWHAAAAGA